MIGVKEEGCPLPCGQMARWTYLGRIDEDSRDWAQIECRCCGKFLINGTLVALLDIGNINRASEADLNLQRYLPAHTRQASERGEVIKLLDCCVVPFPVSM